MYTVLLFEVDLLLPLQVYAKKTFRFLDFPNLFGNDLRKCYSRFRQPLWDSLLLEVSNLQGLAKSILSSYKKERKPFCALKKIEA